MLLLKICLSFFLLFSFQSQSSLFSLSPFSLLQQINPNKRKFCIEMEDDFIADEGINSQTKNEKKPLLECYICKEKIKTHPSLLNHFNDIHPGQRPYKCDDCFHTSNTATHLSLHKKTRHPLETDLKPYICSFCDKSFLLPSDLKPHEKRHAGIKDFKCAICLESYYSNRDLKSHKKKLHTEKSSPCLFCSQESNTLYNLQQHSKEMHPLEKIICEHCGKKFLNIQNTNKHKTTCKSNKKYKREASSSHKESPNYEENDPNKKDPHPDTTDFNLNFPPSVEEYDLHNSLDLDNFLNGIAQGANDPNKKDPHPDTTDFNLNFPPSVEEYDLKNSIDLDNFLNGIAQGGIDNLLNRQA